ncbi:alcohol dehydrogenase catalytic domain-containing protein, partial [Streptosporangium sp. NPDC048865]|uniref:alcohol dehydrogenase catalytic domain-containing protein n=1 Tax=Streptosporangium sp. NPDC048865 TaxID=3155766 RepID=UPI00342DDCBF
MRAARYDRYGPPEVLYEGTLPKPVAGPGEVLVRVHAAGVNGGESLARTGRVRLVTGRSFPQGTGVDFVGEVAALGSPMSALSVGDRVWGLLPRGSFGSAAEFVAVRPRRLAFAPKGLDPVQAVTLL